MHQMQRVRQMSHPGMVAITASEHVKQEQGEMTALHAHVGALPAQAHPRLHLITV